MIRKKKQNRKQKKKNNNGITYPLGYKAAAVEAGIKKAGLDMALLFSIKPAICSAVFSKNKIKSATVQISIKRIRNKINAIIMNSGNANSGTGKKGMKDTIAITSKTAEVLNIPEESVLIASTGVIGEYLPVKKMLKAIPILKDNLSEKSGIKAAKAILTTDTKIKVLCRNIKYKSREIRIGCMAKGSGMINPQMATMLCFITTDAVISRNELDRILKNTVNNTLNKLDIDGDSSTNDMVVFLANGEADNSKLDSNALTEFESTVQEMLYDLSIQLARDGEGVTKLIRINVEGCKSLNSAKLITRSVGDSLLVKTAFYGENPNWGRILMAIGNSGAEFDPEKIDITIGNVPVYISGEPVPGSDKKLVKILKKDYIIVNINVHNGRFNDFLLTTDISKKYVDINSAYKT